MHTYFGQVDFSLIKNKHSIYGSVKLSNYIWDLEKYKTV